MRVNQFKQTFMKLLKTGTR